PVAATDRARFEGAVAAARATLERRAQERAEREARDAALAAARASRERLCDLVEQLHGEDALDRLEIARSEWEGLPEDPEGPAHEASTTRFEQACSRARERHDNRQRLAQVAARLDEVSREAEQLAAQEDSPAYAWDSVAREWRTLKETEGLPPLD